MGVYKTIIRTHLQTRIKPDPQVFLGMAARAQTVDTGLFFFIFRAAWVQGYQIQGTRFDRGWDNVQ